MLIANPSSRSFSPGRAWPYHPDDPVQMVLKLPRP